MVFAYSDKVNALRARVSDFMERYVYPNVQVFRDQVAASGNPHHHAEIVDEL
jgi:acyl-CoA dehydrogenase